MAVVKLFTKRVEKPWGRRTLLPAFDDVMNCGEPVGEIWFQMPDGSEPELLVKYLFTSENLSIQVHPDDEGAKARGYPRGKDEAWVVLEADPGATIADRKSTRLNPVTNAHLVCRLLLEKKKT